MTVQDIDVDHNIWVKSVPYLKGNTTSKKPIPLTGDLIKVQEELLKLHKYIYLMTDLLFVNIITLFLTLISEICFTDIKHLANRKVETICKAFKEINSYYMKHGIQTTTLHTDGEFSQLQAMIYEYMPGGTRINISIVNEHFPDIEI